MTKREQYQHSVTIEAFVLDGRAWLTWSVHRSRRGEPSRRLWRMRRVLVRVDREANIPQLTTLAARMAAYVLPKLPGSAHWPRGEDWMEVGATEWSGSPGGGKGGECPNVLPNSDRTADPIMTAELYHQSAPAAARGNGMSEANSFSSLDRKPVWPADGQRALPGL